MKTSPPEASLERIHNAATRIGRPVRLMEVCGTHTHVVARNGLRSLFPENVALMSGPGCPVCVTAQHDVQRMISLARLPGVTVCTFGDMIRVPGNDSSLEQERAAGADVRIVYSPDDAVAFARKNPEREVAFLAVGFETTAPTIAAAALAAADAAVLSGETRIDGFMTPGHVTTIIGSAAYETLASEHAIPCVTTGFDPPDVLEGVAMLLEKIAAGESGSFIQYRRAVTRHGNARARDIMYRLFEVADADWRGLGVIANSGLKLRPAREALDACRRFSLPDAAAVEIPGCRCGEVLSGMLQPDDCPMFGATCTPRNPLGPCMVSSEGSCAARYRYG